MKVLVSSVVSDSHTWNLVYLQLVLEELGHEVTNLGACVPDDLLIAESVRQRPDLIVISSVNGHGRNDGKRVGPMLRGRTELAGTPMVIGGKLGTDGAESGNQELRAAGFDGVFTGDASMEAFRLFLSEMSGT